MNRWQITSIAELFKLILILQLIMPKKLTIEDKSAFRIFSTGLAGAVASFLTQPLQVMKTNRINTPAMLYYELHKKIMSKGWKTYMRGSSIAVTRQAYGFTIYTQLLARLQSHLLNRFPTLNKYLNYSVSSVAAKLIAMIFQSPLTLLKTRVQCVGSATIMEEAKKIIRAPRGQLTKGLGSSIAREGFYTLFHYNTYRFLKDQLFLKRMDQHATFIPAFVAGVVAITVSQPFQVIRSQISLRKFNGSVSIFVSKHWRQFGIRGFFVGFLPRLLRKPINSGICWTVLEWARQLE